MIGVVESAEYEVGFEMSKVVGQIQWIKNEIMDKETIDKSDISSKLDDILNKLKNIHGMMQE